jgi:hypothetical protein
MKESGTAKKLRDHLFEQMERLNDPKANLETELARATALAKVGTVIVNSAKQEIEMMKLANAMKPKGKGAKQIELKPLKNSGREANA